MYFIIVIGYPGAGKGTQSKKIAQNYNLLHCSLGDLLRDHINQNGQYKDTINESLTAGHLVEHNIVCSIFKEYVINKLNHVKGIVLDGFPRDIQQTDYLNIFSKEYNIPINKVIEIYISQQTVFERLQLRRQCPKCKEIWHLKYKAPKKDNSICDICNTPLIIRSDDNIKVIKSRLESYTKYRNSIKNIYEKKNLFVSINGEDNPDQIFKQIKNSLHS